MVEEEVVALCSPAPLDHHKRKLEDLEPEETAPVSDGEHVENGVTVKGVSDASEAKRPRVDDAEREDLDGEGGNENDEADTAMQNDPQRGEALEEEQPLVEEVTIENTESSVQEDAAQKVNPEADGVQLPSSKTEQLENVVKPSEDDPLPVTEMPQLGDTEQSVSELGNQTFRKMEVPNQMVGVLIGKSGDTIRNLQHNSGAKIQITRDVDADPGATTRPVEIIGTMACINKAEKLIKEVIAEADAGGSPSLVARGFTQAAGTLEQIEIQVSNDKVGLVIGKGGETIKSLQTRSGARIQLVPQHLPEGDKYKERTVRVSGDKKQIDMARELIKEVMNKSANFELVGFKTADMAVALPHGSALLSWCSIIQPLFTLIYRRKHVKLSTSLSNFAQQQAYRPRGGPGALPQWGPRAPHNAPSMPYDYQQHRGGPYPSQNQQYPPYGGYPSQGPPRGGFNSGWEQRPPMQQQGPPNHTGGYDYYGGQGVPQSAPHPSYMSSGRPSMGHNMPSHAQANYNYGQPPYSQTQPSHQGYAPASQSASYQDPSQGYPNQQQYPTQYNVPPPAHSYPATQPSNVPYQTPVSVAPSYGQTVPAQQPYPYASVPATTTNDGYTQQQQPAAGSIPGYPQQSATQPVAGYSQPMPGYSQAYGQYLPTQQGYSNQAPATAASYGYQGQADPSAYAAAAQAYSSAPQAAYTQPATNQASYDQSGVYPPAAVPAPAAAAVGTALPAGGYPQQYDASQMYGASG